MDESDSTTGQTAPLYCRAEVFTPTAAIRLSFSEVYQALPAFLSHQPHPLDEDVDVDAPLLSFKELKMIFESLLLSYFGNYTAPPKQLLDDMLELSGIDREWFEGQHAETVMAIMDHISIVTKVQFRNLVKGDVTDMLAAGGLAKQLKIIDARMHGNDHVIITMPLRTLQRLQNEYRPRNPAHPA